MLSEVWRDGGRESLRSHEGPPHCPRTRGPWCLTLHTLEDIPEPPLPGLNSGSCGLCPPALALKVEIRSGRPCNLGDNTRLVMPKARKVLASPPVVLSSAHGSRLAPHPAQKISSVSHHNHARSPPAPILDRSGVPPLFPPPAPQRPADPLPSHGHLLLYPRMLPESRWATLTTLLLPSPRSPRGLPHTRSSLKKPAYPSLVRRSLR